MAKSSTTYWYKICNRSLPRMKYVVDLWSYSSVTCIWLGDKILTTITPVSLLISTSCMVQPSGLDSQNVWQIVPQLYRRYVTKMIGGSGHLFILPITSCRPLIPSIYAILPSYTAVLSARHFRDEGSSFRRATGPVKRTLRKSDGSLSWKFLPSHVHIVVRNELAQNHRL